MLFSWFVVRIDIHIEKINDENTPRPVGVPEGDTFSQNSIFKCIIGWWFEPLWKMMEFVSWDYSSQYMEKQKFMFQTTNQALDEHLGAPTKVLRMRVKTTAGFQVLLWRLWVSQGSSDSCGSAPNHPISSKDSNLMANHPSMRTCMRTTRSLYMTSSSIVVTLV